MALFKKKKLDLPKPPIAPPRSDFTKPELKIPKFPEPDFSESFSMYKPIIPRHDIEDIKEAVKPKIEFIKDDLEENPLSAVIKEKPITQPRFEEKPQTYKSSLEENPLFVKIETYEDAIKDLELIKDNINKIEEVLNNLDTIKKQEDREIEQWRQRVAKIKEKILSIDKNLFEKR